MKKEKRWVMYCNSNIPKHNRRSEYGHPSSTWHQTAVHRKCKQA